MHFIDWDFPKVRYPLAELSALDEHAFLHGIDSLPPAFFHGYGDVPADLLLVYRIVGCIGWLASDDWSGWNADATIPPRAHARLTEWHRRLVAWTGRIPELVRWLE